MLGANINATNDVSEYYIAILYILYIKSTVYFINYATSLRNFIATV